MDRLAAEGRGEAFLLVTMNNTELGGADAYDEIYANMKDHLVPYMEQNYNVSKKGSDRAFAGLSMGAWITSQMYYKDPLYFGNFGIFSGSDAPNFPKLKDYSDYAVLTVYLAAGWADLALIRRDARKENSTIRMSEELDAAGLIYNKGEGIHIVQGAHDWFTWSQILRDYILTSLWKNK